jgi:hypothetical protein
VKRFPPRLHVLFASRSEQALVIRRGPSNLVATIAWDRRRDRFTLGQWMKGRLYERRCDLSPDGAHLLYFAMNGHWQSESRGSWTAISRAPYLRAIGFFTKGDCWHGGGLFVPTRKTEKSRYWLNDGYGHHVVRQTNEVTRDATYRPSPSFGGECPGVYYHRLMRDGWTYLAHDKGEKWKSVDVFEKTLVHGFRLRKIAHCETGAPPGKGCYWDEHVLIDPSGEERVERDWEWAELDGSRLVYATDGKLFARSLDQKGLADPRMLHDFTPMKFEAIAAPYG